MNLTALLRQKRYDMEIYLPGNDMSHQGCTEKVNSSFHWHVTSPPSARLYPASQETCISVPEGIGKSASVLTRFQGRPVHVSPEINLIYL